MPCSRRALLRSAPALALTAGLSSLAPVARAQVTVYDPAAVAQAVKQVQQGLQQVQALQSQLAQQTRMLQGLGVDVTGPLRDIAGQAAALLQQARGLGYQAASISQGFADLYPDDLSGASARDLAARLAAWSQNSRQTLQEAMQVQNQIVQAQGVTSQAVASAVGASQSAAGQTAAVQATNQLLAALSTQLTQLQTLMITQARQAETWEAERRGLVVKGEADRRRNSAVTRIAPRFSGDVLQ
ncbi:conjugal transfer protein TrbJ [Caulobacter soli]|uniref:conjugal transfer protein TrbJ n=1 Tax=Caulobacter soli TaxID=2708539 RepID=UPI0013EACCB6|nr:conjugal transfer protein TrbJ [Caulobacter soli]